MKRGVSAFLHHKFVPMFRRIVTLPSSVWMNLAQVNAGAIGSRRYIDCREVLRYMATQSYRNKKRTDFVPRPCKKKVSFFSVFLIWQVSGNVAIIDNRSRNRFVITHWYTVLQETNLAWSSNFYQLSTLRFYGNVRTYNIFCGHNILTEGVFATQQSSNAGISVWRFVWDTTSCRFRSGTVPSPPVNSASTRTKFCHIDSAGSNFHRNRTTSLVSTRCNNPQKHHLSNTLRVNLQTYECKCILCGAVTWLLSIQAVGMQQGHKDPFHVFPFHTRKVFTGTNKPVDKRSDS